MKLFVYKEKEGNKSQEHYLKLTGNDQGTFITLQVCDEKGNIKTCGNMLNINPVTGTVVRCGGFRIDGFKTDGNGYVVVQ